MAGEPAARGLREGLKVEGSDGGVIGEVAEVWRDVGVGEAWGAVGAIPNQGAEAADARKYAYSEAMPGEGASYFRVTRPNGRDLYIPFSALGEVRDGVAVLAVGEDVVGDMQWDILPDFVNVQSVSDAQAPGTKA